MLKSVFLKSTLKTFVEIFQVNSKEKTQKEECVGWKTDIDEALGTEPRWKIRLMVHQPNLQKETSRRAAAHPLLTDRSVLQSNWTLKRDSICSTLLFKGEFTSESYYNGVLFPLVRFRKRYRYMLPLLSQFLPCNAYNWDLYFKNIKHMILLWLIWKKVECKRIA